MTDRELIEAFLAGEKSAVATVVGWIKMYVGNSTWRGTIWAEDVVSDALYRVYRQLHAGHFRGKSSVHTYVRGITHYAIIDWVRRQRRFDSFVRNFPNDSADYFTPEDHYRQARKRELMLRIEEHIDRNCTQIWDLVFGEDLSYREVGVRIGKTEGAVKSLMFRCKEKAMELARSWQHSKPESQK